MKNESGFHISLLFAMAFLMLLTGLVFGFLAGLDYIFPSYLRPYFGFETLRPMHVSLVIFWILLASSASVLSGLNFLWPGRLSTRLIRLQSLLWGITIIGVIFSYLRGKFGGREYWEFNPVWAIPLGLAWLAFLINFFRTSVTMKNQAVYVWMWMTGIVFFLFIFIENYLWMIPYFRERMITDMTVQWKVNGSLVGAWNQMIYGTAFFLMDKISGDRKIAHSRLAFIMYFLGLFNLMFNWGHHIYTLPTASYVRIVGYAVSMTEWIFLLKIIYQWKSGLRTAKTNFGNFPYRYIIAADFWIFLNMTQAIFMSVPAFNVFTHGTHVTVAHAMGTTIGINTMLLLGAGFAFASGSCSGNFKSDKLLRFSFWTAQISLLVFWLSLNAAGLIKGFWQMRVDRTSFQMMMTDIKPYLIVFAFSGFLLMISLIIPALVLLRSYLVCGCGLKIPLFRGSDERLKMKAERN